MLTFLVAHHGREDGVFGSFFQLQDAADNLIARLGRNRLIALGAIPLSHPREKNSQEVINLSDRADGRTWIVAGRLLRNRNRRAKARDQIDIRLGHLAQKLTCVAGQAFDVAPLSFGEHSIERERAFAATADTGQADQLVARQDKIDILKIVFAGTFDNDIRSRHKLDESVHWNSGEFEPSIVRLQTSLPNRQTEGPFEGTEEPLR